MYNPELRSRYEKVRPAVKEAVEKVMMDPRVDNSHITIARRAAFLSAEAEQAKAIDPITGLYGKRFYDEAILRAIQISKRYNSDLALLTLDLDDLRGINNTYGHDAGNLLLRSSADLLRNTIRTSDLPFRIGGDEFTIILPNTSGDHAVDLAGRIRHTVESQLLPQIQTVFPTRSEPLTISIGCTDMKELDIHSFNDSEAAVKALEEQADIALYNSKYPQDQKLTPKNRVTRWHPGMTMPKMK